MYNEANNNKMAEYADSIYQYLLSNNLTSYDIYDYDDFAEELDNAIQNGEIEDIPELDREDAFKMAIDKLTDEPEDFGKTSDADWEDKIKSSWEADKDSGFTKDVYEEMLKETNQIISMMNESLASKKAKKLGLVHVGFGNYSSESGGPAEYKTVNGKLRKVKGGAPKKKVKSVEKKEEPLPKKKGGREKKPKTNMIKNLRRISGDKFTYEYEYNGKKYKFTLNKTERKNLKNSSILAIVKNRMKKKTEHQKEEHFKKGEKEKGTKKGK